MARQCRLPVRPASTAVTNPASTMTQWTARRTRSALARPRPSMPQPPVTRPQSDPNVPAAEPVGAVLSMRALKAACASCSLRELCVPFGLTAEELAHIDSLVGSRKRLRKAETLFDSGDAFTDLYAVWLGLFLL